MVPGIATGEEDAKRDRLDRLAVALGMAGKVPDLNRVPAANGSPRPNALDGRDTARRKRRLLHWAEPRTSRMDPGDEGRRQTFTKLTHTPDPEKPQLISKIADGLVSAVPLFIVGYGHQTGLIPRCF